MQKRLLTSLLVVALLFGLTVSVFAQEGESIDGSPGQDETAITEQSTTISERQETRRQRLQLTLGEAEKQKINNRCKAAQKVLENVSSKLDQTVDKRQQVQDRVTAKLNSLSNRLQNQGIDTTKLDEAIVQTQTQIDELNQQLEDHRQALADINEIDCQADPEGFKLILEDAREQRKQIVEEAKQVREQIKSNVKTELQNIRALLEAGSSASDTNSSDQTNSTDPDSPVSSEEVLDGAN